MPVEDPIGSLENVLRDLIERVVRAEYGLDWIDRLGVTAERIACWKERREVEAKRRPGLTIDERLLYYADFYDLTTMISKHWALGFKDCFGDLAALRLDLKRLEAYRNPIAHSRNLRPFEVALVHGICGLRRNEVTIYLSQNQGQGEEYFARIEEVIDSLGHRFVGDAIGAEAGAQLYHQVEDIRLRPGDVMTFTCRAWDPEGKEVTWKFTSPEGEQKVEGSEVEFEWSITEKSIGGRTFIKIVVLPQRSYSRSAGYDDTVDIVYRVLPNASL